MPHQKLFRFTEIACCAAAVAFFFMGDWPRPALLFAALAFAAATLEIAIRRH